jgi:beta-lactamase superfamily II metal-dependent hydrolase
VDGNGDVLEFLSYEGSVTATAGPASGLTSSVIGVSESSSTPAGYSLQLTGTGCTRSAFSWASPSASSPGSINTGQSCSGSPPTAPPTAPPTSGPTVVPTPAPTPVPNTDIICANHVLITQVLYDEPGSTANEEWVELYNPTAASVDLSSWSLTSNGNTYVLPQGASIASGGRFILGKSGFLAENGFESDVTDFSVSLGNGGRVLTLNDDSSGVVDEVGWETGIWSSLVAGDGEVIIRKNGGDSDDASDWEVAAPVAGGKFYACSGLGGGVGNGCWGDHLLLSKVYYDTDATLGETDGTHEWIEIFNPTKNNLDLTNWELVDGGASYTIASGSIPSTGYFVVAKSGFQAKYGVTPDHADLSLSLNNGGEQLRLKDANGVEVDFVAWEGGHSSCGTECVGWDIMATDGQYLVRSTPKDTDSPDDWVRVSFTVVPKAGRPTCGTPSCVFPDTLTATSVDIGQGDMSLVATPTKFLVGDTGESNWNSAYDVDTFDEWFRGRHGDRCTHIDYVVISHFQVDHLGYIGYGGLWKLRNGYKYDIARTLFRDYRSYVGSRSGTYTNWVNYLDVEGGEADLNAKIAEVGTTDIDMGFGATTTIVHVDGKTPSHPNGCRPEILDYFNETATNPPSENDYSVAFVVSLGDFDMFIGGDVSGEDYVGGFNYKYHDTETCLSEDVGEVDVYRVNHHGSDHSSNQFFIDTLVPQVSLISVGADNPYGHPRQSVVDRLDTANTQIYMTQRGDSTVNIYGAKVVSHCDITVASDGSTFTVSGTGVPGDVYTSRSAAARRTRSLLRGS